MSVIDGESPVGAPLTMFLIQLIIIVLLCRFLAFLFKFIKQPPVIAEVVAGIILGPSALSKNVAFSNALFPKTSITTLNVFANVGLIVFMFIVGLELDPTLLRRNARNSVIISVVAMIAPFCLGLAASVAVYKELIPATVPFSSFLLFVAVALSITAFPVLARILAETRLLDDRVGNIALSSAAVDDVVAWCLLALVVAIARAHSPLSALYTFLVLFAFIAFMLFGVHPLLKKLARKSRVHQSLKLQVIALLLLLMFLCSWFTEIIGVHAIFGAFLLGVIIPRENNFALEITERIEDLVVIVLLPLYFTYSGLRTDLGSIKTGTAGGLCVLIILTACIGKIGGGTLAARFCRNSWRESFTVGVLMNTKGLVELIVLNLGLDVGVLTTQVFTIFVVMALVTTFLTTPIVHFIYLRHRQANAQQKENYHMVLFTGEQKVGLDMISFARMLSVPNVTTIKAILFNEISERPSSYFFHLSNKLKQDVPFFKDKSKKPVMHVVKKVGQKQGLTVRTKVLNSIHLEQDFVTTAQNYICEMIMVGVNANVEELSIVPSDSSKKTLSDFIDLGIDQFTGSFSPTGRVVNAAVRSVNSKVGIFICKTVGGGTIRKAAFVYYANEYELPSLETILKIEPVVQVDIYTPPGISVDFIPDSHKNITIIESEEPVAALLTAQNEIVYDVTVIGSKRNGATEAVTNLLRSSAVNVMVIYPAVEQAVLPFRSDERNTVV